MLILRYNHLYALILAYKIQPQNDAIDLNKLYMLRRYKSRRGAIIHDHDLSPSAIINGYAIADLFLELQIISRISIY